MTPRPLTPEQTRRDALASLFRDANVRLRVAAHKAGQDNPPHISSPEDLFEWIAQSVESIARQQETIRSLQERVERLRPREAAL